MGNLVISLLTLVLLLISAFVVLIILMQRTSQNGGMGAALGGGAAESAFGSNTSNVLTKATIYSTILFFVVALVLYLIYQSKASERAASTVDANALISNIAEESADADVESMPSTTTESVDEGTLSVDEVSTEAMPAEATEVEADMPPTSAK